MSRSSPRVVSLLSSATETVCALGLESLLVGRSHECDFPTSVLSLPVCSKPRINIDGSSLEIDLRVRAAAASGLSLYEVDSERLRELKPDVILTQTQCDVCAVSLKDVEDAVCQFLGHRPTIVSVKPDSLSDIWHDFRRIATALDVPGAGETLVLHLQQNLATIQQQVSKESDRPSIVCLEWLAPMMAGGNWLPELVEISGGVNLLGVAGQHSSWMTWEELQHANPDIILALPCGWGLQKSASELNSVMQSPDWSKLRAAQLHQVFVADGNQYFNRPGPRILESAEILAEILHPRLCPPKHRGAGWCHADQFYHR